MNVTDSTRRERRENVESEKKGRERSVSRENVLRGRERDRTCRRSVRDKPWRTWTDTSSSPWSSPRR